MGNSDSRESFPEVLDAMLFNDLTSADRSFWQELIMESQTTEEIYISMTPVFFKTLVNKFPQNLEQSLRVYYKVLEEVTQGANNNSEELIFRCLAYITRVVSYIPSYPSLKTELWEKSFAFDMVNILMKLLFTENFTIEKVSDRSRFEIDPNRIWTRGLINKEDKKERPEFIQARVHILRCLIVCFSEIMFVPYTQISDYVNPWTWICGSNETAYIKDTFYSLLNTCLTFEFEGIGAYLGQSKLEERYSALSCQVLIIMLDSKVPDEFNSVELKLALKFLQMTSEDGDIELVNVFEECLIEICEEEDFEFISRNLARLLGSLENKNSFILKPGKSIQYFEELLILLWHLLDKNYGFFEFLVRSEYIETITGTLLEVLENNLDNIGKIGLYELVVYILLELSGDREFAVSLYSSEKDYYEALITVFSDSFTKSNFEPLIGMMLSTLLNISPYIKKISRNGSEKLVFILELLSSKRYLTNSPNNFKHLFDCFSLVNNRFQYEWDGSLDLVYMLICERKRLKRNIKLDFPEAENWKNNLPSSLLEKVYEKLVPLIKSLKENPTEEEVMACLEEETMVGVFPSPHEIFLRILKFDQEMENWLTSFTWGVVATEMTDEPIFNLVNLKLFTVTYGNDNR